MQTIQRGVNSLEKGLLIHKSSTGNFLYQENKHKHFLSSKVCIFFDFK